MDRTERIARLLIIPVVMLIGYLLVSDGRVPTGTEVAGEAPGREGGTTTSSGSVDSTTTSPGSIEGDGSTATSGGSPQAEDAADEARLAADEARLAADEEEPSRLDLAEASTTAPPQEPRGVYRNGKLVLRGSVPGAEVAEAFAARAATVLGADNVTVEMTLDQRVVGETLTIDVDQEFRFPSGGIVFDVEYEALLNLGVAALQLLPEATLVVTGHTDDVGEEGTNVALSQARAQVVVDWMVDRGISPERVVARGAGETEPIADNAAPGGREANRRVEAVLEGVKAEAPR